MCRATFSDTLALKSAWHPLLNKLSFSPITPNDVYVGPEANFVLITGPNMAGKSTYLKMAAIVQIMAQIGSFVPAAEASVRVSSRIFARTGQNDDLENNLSAFQGEMTDVNYILKNFDNDSLVVIDELARSTSAEEGYALSHAICEQFIASKAFVILSTHFLDLARLDSLYPNVENFHFPPQVISSASAERNRQFAFSHTIKRGSYRGPMYGFEIASLSKFPKQVIERAKEFAAEMRAKGNLNLTKNDSETRRKRAVMKLGFRLAHIKRYYKEVDIVVLRNHLKNLKTEYLREIAECDAIINIADEL